ncbi:hypothetical protein OUZ56_025259 [Daphnia magna]|uniref:Uncharacterized protein n=1 Tax=Daphnia magna TaxID=35525 RepID=A0ABQ9ZKP2_9CRUS|nr:hypothetical protein OUZ56_025259 [Daphnia magna]
MKEREKHLQDNAESVNNIRRDFLAETNDTYTQFRPNFLSLWSFGWVSRFVRFFLSISVWLAHHQPFLFWFSLNLHPSNI